VPEGEVILTSHERVPLAAGELADARRSEAQPESYPQRSSTWYRRQGLLQVLVAVVFVLGAMLILSAAALPRQLDHDEHQFVASGVLLARNGLLPYFDYPYFHVPNLVFLYAAVDLFAASPLLAARIVSLGFALLTLSLVWWIVWTNLEAGRLVLRMGLAGAAVMMAALSPLSLYTVGRAWNHDAAVAMFLLAFGLADASRVRRPGVLLTCAGLACGLAVGTRLSFAAAAAGLALLVAWWFRHESRRTVARALGLFLVGGALGLLPTIILALRAPNAFVFGNLTYAGLNEAYRAATGFTAAMDLAGKVRFLIAEVLLEPRDAILFVIFNIMIVAEAVRVFVLHERVDSRPPAIAMIMLLLLVGALAPTPSWYQYYYALVPFGATAAAIAAGRLHILRARIPIGAASMILAALAMAWFSRADVSNLRRLRTPASWTPTVVRQIGERIASLTGKGRVLTLSPIYVLEGGGTIYEQFASGPFAWRVGSFVPAGLRENLHLVSPDELTGILTSRPAAGILVGKEADLEGPMISYAQANGFQAADVGDGLTLWVRPEN
jgi:hypothetical protein